MMEKTAPAISVITATFNAAMHLPYTIRSLREQTARDFEWIVVDGNSTDGTQALLQENQDVATRWVSEPDSGIYDAWNKACKIARGEWILFLGAGDVLAAPDTLAKCIEKLESASPDTVLVYGRQTLLSPSGRIPIETMGVPWVELRGRWDIGRPALPPHGAAFQRRCLFAGERPFDLRFPIASDSHFLLRAVQLREPAFMPLEVTRSPIGGISFRLDTARKIGREICAMNRDLGLRPPLAVRLHELLRLSVIAVLVWLPVRTAHRLADLIRLFSGKSPRWTLD